MLQICRPALLLLPLFCCLLLHSCQTSATLGGHSFPAEMAAPIRCASNFLEHHPRISGLVRTEHWLQGASISREVTIPDNRREVITTLRTKERSGDIRLQLERVGSGDEWRVTEGVLKWQGREHPLVP